MGRRIIYRIEDRPGNKFTDEEWASVERLQHWYNSEFSWSTGRLRFKRFVIFPNTEDFANLSLSVWEIIAKRQQTLREKGLPEREIIAQMEQEKLLIVKWGGYFDECLASGFTRVADNEWNAFLTCDFLLKASTLLPDASIVVKDEGKFIKTGILSLHNASVVFQRGGNTSTINLEEICASRHAFSIVDADKYARHPSFRNVVPEFGRLKEMEKREVLKNWNWLGYDGKYDSNGDDNKGFDLNSKVRSFLISD
jgi:hypothetical protein